MHNYMKVPRGLRNNNAGNIRLSKTRYLGEVVPSTDKAFKQFKTPAWGYRAVFVLLDSYSRKGFLTLRQMITRYAPPSENNTENYIRYVAQNAVVNPEAPLDVNDRNVMVLVVAAISRMENGIAADMDDVVAGWELFIKHRP